MMINLKDKRTKVSTPMSVHEILQSVLESEDPIDRDKEHFWVFYLDVRHSIKGLELVTLGILDSVIVHPREVFTRAVSIRCASIILAHNHPSGDSKPSQEDIKMTNRMVEAGEILDIKIIDHLITSESGYYSFKEQGRL